MSNSDRVPESREEDAWLSDEQLKHVAPAESEPFHGPVPYTLILGRVGTLAVNPAMFAKLPYDPINAFIPVAMIASVPNVIAVHPGLPVKTLKEFVDLAKAKPGTLNYGSAGNGSAVGPVAGDIHRHAAAVPFIKEGKLRALAVGSAKRIPSLPDVPAVAESGYPGFETSQWYGILAPAGTPNAVLGCGRKNRRHQDGLTRGARDTGTSCPGCCRTG